MPTQNSGWLKSVRLPVLNALLCSALLCSALLCFALLCFGQCLVSVRWSGLRYSVCFRMTGLVGLVYFTVSVVWKMPGLLYFVLLGSALVWFGR